MSIVQSEDLFDFDGYSRQLKNLEANTEAFASATVSSLSRITNGYELSLKAAADLRKELGGVALQQADLSQKSTGYKQKIDTATISILDNRKALNSLTETQKLNSQLVEQATKRLAELQSRYQALDPSQKGYEKQQRAILAETRNLTREIGIQSKILKDGKRIVDAAEGSYQHLKKTTGDLKKQLDQMPSAYDKQSGKIDQANKAAVALNAQYQKQLDLLGKIERGQGVHNRNVGNYPGKGVMGVASAAAGVLGITLSAASIIEEIGEVGAEYEKLGLLVENSMQGNQRATREAQAVIKDFADHSPASVAEVTTAFTRLRDIGINPTKQTLVQLSDMAIAKNKTIMDYVEALADAGMGEFERLKEFGINAQRAGDKVTFTFKGVSTTIAASQEAITNYLVELGKVPGVMGATDRLAESSAGKWSTVKDTFRQIASDLFEKVGPALNSLMGWMTGVASVVQSGLNSSLDNATQALADQTRKVEELEGKLPNLLQRYDELKAKSTLTAKEQGELRTVINDITALAPSAATGFDNYGNALDINKGKVLAFADAQRQLNQELNKQAIQEAQSESSKRLKYINFTNNLLNKRAGAAPKTGLAGFLSGDTQQDRDELLEGLKVNNQKFEASLLQRLQLGDKLTEADKKYIDGSKSVTLQRIKVVEGYNDELARLDKQQAALLMKGDEASSKQRDKVLKEIKLFNDKKRELLNIGQTQAPTVTLSNKPLSSSTASNDKALNNSLGLSKANSDKVLKQLESDRQDGLISEQDFIEKRLQITLDGISGRMAILARANKKETDDYKKLQADKIEVDLEYKRAQLKLDIAASNARMDEELKALDDKKSQGLVSEREYVEQRHQVMLAGLNRQQQILTESGKEQSELMKKLRTEALSVDADYHTKRLKVEKEAWNESLKMVKEVLKEIADTTDSALQDSIQQLSAEMESQQRAIESSVARGQLSAAEGEDKLYRLRMDHIGKIKQAVFDASLRQEMRSKNEVDTRVQALELYKKDATRTPAEIADADIQIQRLLHTQKEQLDKAEQKRKDDLADADVKRSQNVADRQAQIDQEVAQLQSQILQKKFELAATVVNGFFEVSKAYRDREIDSLTQQKEKELELAGSNADAKTAIEKNFDKQISALRRRQAIADRAAAVFNIALSTAQAIAQINANVAVNADPTQALRFTLMALVGGIGAAQITATLAQPLPAYRTGKSSSDPYTGKALAGEAGAELFVDRSGFAQLLTGPTIIDTKKGDTIFPAPVTSEILRLYEGSSGIRSMEMYNEAVNRGWDAKVVEGALIQMMAGNSSQLTKKDIREAFAEALDSRPSEVTTIDEDGFRSYLKKGNNTTEYLNKRYKFS